VTTRDQELTAMSFSAVQPGPLPQFPRVSRVLSDVTPEELEPLVPRAVRERIVALSAGFPVGAQTVCYECRLSERDARVDLALCLFPSLDGSADRVIEELLPLHGGSPEWTRALEFVRSWSDPGSSLLPRVPFVWVAFDLDRDLPALPAPCLGLCVDPSFFARRMGAPDQPWADAQGLEVLADECFRRFHDEALPGQARELMRQCLLSPGVGARHFSFMLGRTPATFKLDVQLPVTGVGALLERIGWPGPSEALERNIGALVPSGGLVQLNLVLHPKLVSPLEVELLTVPAEVTPGRREVLLDQLIAAGLCSLDKALVLRKLVERPALETAGGAVIGRSWYVKVRFEGASPVEAKAYLGLMPQLWPQLGRAVPAASALG
jgi:hypothetical protein